MNSAKENVIFDINVFIDAARGQNEVARWNENLVALEGRMKGVGSISRMAIHMLLNGGKHSLITDQHIHYHVQHWLTQPVSEKGYGWAPGAAVDFNTWIAQQAKMTGGHTDNLNPSKAYTNNYLRGLVPDSLWEKAGAEVDHEDRRLVALARNSNTDLIVTNDGNFLKLRSFVPGVRIMDTEQFVQYCLGN